MTLKEKHDIETEKYISRIIRATAKHTGAGIDEIDDAKTRRKTLDVFARTVAMIAVIRFVGMSQEETAKRFGYADHSTLSYLLRRFRADAATEEKVAAVLNEIEMPQMELFVRQSA